MGKSTISMAMFHCFLYVHQRVPAATHPAWRTLAGPQQATTSLTQGQVGWSPQQATFQALKSTPCLQANFQMLFVV